MKLYIGTLIENQDGQAFVQTHVSGTHWGLATLIDDAISVEENERSISFPRDFSDILHECEFGNQHNEPLSIGEDVPFAPEILLSTYVAEV